MFALNGRPVSIFDTVTLCPVISAHLQKLSSTASVLDQTTYLPISPARIERLYSSDVSRRSICDANAPPKSAMQTYMRYQPPSFGSIVSGGGDVLSPAKRKLPLMSFVEYPVHSHLSGDETGERRSFSMTADDKSDMITSFLSIPLLRPRHKTASLPSYCDVPYMSRLYYTVSAMICKWDPYIFPHDFL